MATPYKNFTEFYQKVKEHKDTNDDVSFRFNDVRLGICKIPGICNETDPRKLNYPAKEVGFLWSYNENTVNACLQNVDGVKRWVDSNNSNQQIPVKKVQKSFVWSLQTIFNKLQEISPFAAKSFIQNIVEEQPYSSKQLNPLLNPFEKVKFEDKDEFKNLKFSGPYIFIKSAKVSPNKSLAKSLGNNIGFDSTIVKEGSTQLEFYVKDDTATAIMVGGGGDRQTVSVKRADPWPRLNTASLGIQQGDTRARQPFRTRRPILSHSSNIFPDGLYIKYDGSYYKVKNIKLKPYKLSELSYEYEQSPPAPQVVSPQAVALQAAAPQGQGQPQEQISFEKGNIIKGVLSLNQKSFAGYLIATHKQDQPHNYIFHFFCSKGYTEGLRIYNEKIEDCKIEEFLQAEGNKKKVSSILNQMLVWDTDYKNHKLVDGDWSNIIKNSIPATAVLHRYKRGPKEQNVGLTLIRNGNQIQFIRSEKSSIWGKSSNRKNKLIATFDVREIRNMTSEDTANPAAPVAVVPAAPQDAALVPAPPVVQAAPAPAASSPSAPWIIKINNDKSKNYKYCVLRNGEIHFTDKLNDNDNDSILDDKSKLVTKLTSDIILIAHTGIFSSAHKLLYNSSSPDNENVIKVHGKEGGKPSGKEVTWTITYNKLKASGGYRKIKSKRNQKKNKKNNRKSKKSK